MREKLYKLKVFLFDLTRYPKPIYRQELYDSYWSSRKRGKMGVPNSFQRYRASWIANRLYEHEGVLDIGCGDGAVLLEMEKIKSLQLMGLDISDDCLKFLTDKGITTLKLDTNKEEDIKKIPQSDNILLLEVIEHIPSPELLLQELSKKTKNSIYISIPNTGYLKHRLRLLFGRFPLQWRVFPGEHVRFWTLKDFKWWVKTLNITDDVTIHCYKGIPFLNKLFPNLFAMGIIARLQISKSFDKQSQPFT